MGALPTMKKFSDDLVPSDGREFEFGGELYRWRYPYWEDMADIFDKELQPSENGHVPTTKEQIEDLGQRIKVMLEPESQKKLDEALSRKDNAVPIAQFSELYRWLLGETSGRPTSPSSASEAGDGAPEASSSEGSS